MDKNKIKLSQRHFEPKLPGNRKKQGKKPLLEQLTDGIAKDVREIKKALTPDPSKPRKTIPRPVRIEAEVVSEQPQPALVSKPNPVNEYLQSNNLGIQHIIPPSVSGSNQPIIIVIQAPPPPPVIVNNNNNNNIVATNRNDDSGCAGVFGCMVFFIILMMATCGHDDEKEKEQQKSNKSSWSSSSSRK